MTKLLQKAIDRIQAMPEKEQDRVARLILGAMETPDERSDDEHKPFWHRAVDSMVDVPAEELDRLPADGAIEHDHYIYGTPKRTE